MNTPRSPIPVSFFGIAVGMLALANAWRVAVRLWHLPAGLAQLIWIRQPTFTAGYWAFSFGVAALPTLAMRLLEGGAQGPVEWLAPVLFVAANLVIGGLLLRTLGLLFTGRLLPLPVSAAPTF